jgi:DNA-binding MarR family transcriptional regulator
MDERQADERHEQIADRLRRVNRLLRQQTPQEWAALDLTMAQMKVLFVLHQSGPAKVSHLAEALSVTAPSMTGTLERLVRQGLVERRDDPADRRLVISQLTAEGQALMERLQQGRRARLLAALGRLNAADIVALDRGLVALEAALEREEPEAPGVVVAAGRASPRPAG